MRYLIISTFLVCFFSPAYAGGGSGATPYMEIPVPFVVNLAEKNTLSFLQVNAQLKVTDENLKQHLYVHMPAIQHTVMLVLSEQSTDDIKSVAGKQKLRQTTLKEVQDLLQEKIGDPAVDEIYFTGFIIQ